MPSGPLPPLAVGLPGAVVLGHADGFSWDEALMVLAPIALLAGVLLYVNRKLARGLAAPGEDPSDDPDGAATGSGEGEGGDHPLARDAARRGATGGCAGDRPAP